MEQIPTVILSYKFKMMRYDRATGRCKLTKHYRTDAGWLCVLEMSRRTGVNKNSIKTRMTAMSPGETGMFDHEHRSFTGNPTDEWLKMGSKPRDRNLRRIAEHGTWEARA